MLTSMHKDRKGGVLARPHFGWAIVPKRGGTPGHSIARLGPAIAPGEILLEEFFKPLGMTQAAGGQDTGDVDRAPQVSSCG